MKANAEQESAAWLMQRAGKFTASRASALMARAKTGPSASRGELLTTLAIERLTGQPVPTYQNEAMRRGSELEGEARDVYGFMKGWTIEESGFVICDDLPNTGCSPDGLVGDDGLTEFKCPNSMAKHLESLRTGEHAQEYKWQIQHQLMSMKRQWNAAVSYDPRFPQGLQIAEVIVQRDEAMIKELRIAILVADAEVESIVSELRARIS